MPQNRTSQDIFNELTGLTNQLNTYTPVGQNDVLQSLLGKVDYFKPQYQALRNAEAEAYASPANILAKFSSDPSAGPSAMARLGAALGSVGRNYATADTLADVINTQRGNLGGIAQSVVDKYNLQRQGIQDKYNMLNPLYQAALQREEMARQQAEAERARKAQAAAIAQQAAYSRMTQSRQGASTGTAMGTKRIPIGTVSTGADGKQYVVMGYDANGQPEYALNPGQAQGGGAGWANAIRNTVGVDSPLAGSIGGWINKSLPAWSYNTPKADAGDTGGISFNPLTQLKRGFNLLTGKKF